MGETARRSRKTLVSQLLREAGQLLQQAGTKVIKAADAQERLEQATTKLRQAEKIARPTVHPPIPEAAYEGKVTRDGLPAPIRQAIMREATHVAKLLERVKTLPVTSDERILTKRRRAQKES